MRLGLLLGLLLLRRGLLLLHRLLLLLGLRLLLGLHDGLLLVVIVVTAAHQGEARRADAGARTGDQQSTARESPAAHPGPVVSL